jgi:hypothetical protein
VLALQRAAGNRVARQAIAGHGRRVLAREPSLDEQVFELTQRIGKSSTVTEPLKQETKALAVRCWAARKVDAPDDAREQLRRLVGALMNNGAQDAGIDVAAVGDAVVQSGALATMGVNSISSEENFLTKAGRLAGVPIAAPTPQQKTTAWLDANTEKIGQALKTLQARGVTGLSGADLSQQVVGQMLSVFFRAATDAEGDIKPDPLGKLGKLNVDPKTAEIVGDCDVWATYGARLFRAIGWVTVAYLSVIPAGADASRAGHAVVLVRLDKTGGTSTFAGVSDFTVKQFKATDEAGARSELLDLALEIYKDNGALKSYSSYYVPAGTDGAYDVKILDPAKNRLTPFKTVP